MAIDIARQAAVIHKTPVAIFCLEMSRDQVVDRILCAQAGVNLWKMRTGYLSSSDDGDFSHLANAMNSLSEAPIYIDDSPFLSSLEIRTKARRLQAEHGLGLLIVDYLQLIAENSHKESRVQEVSDISRNLKGIARELNIPVLALSQLSRAVESRGGPAIPKLSDLRESGCLTGDTLISRADTGKRVPIKDLIGQINIPVHSLDENWKIKEALISKVFSSGKKMVYELRTRSGFKIKASANHPFQKIDGWHRLDQLSIGNFIATPRKISLTSPRNELSSKEIILLAHLLGDGCVLKKQPIHYTSADEENLKIVVKSAKKLFKIKPRLVKQKNWWHVYLPSPYRLARGKHHPIINWYDDLGIKPVRSFEKEIPQKVFSLDEKNICLFLKHLWATDGNLSTKYLKGRKPSANIYYSTTSQKLAEGVKHLLLRLEIRSTISEAKKQDYRICYHLRIQGQDDQLKFLYQIGCYGKRGKAIPKLIKYLKAIKTNSNVDVIPKEIWQQINLDRLDYNLSWRDWAENYGMSYCGTTLLKHGVSKMRLTKILNFLPSVELKKIAESDIFWDKIISITPLKIEEVYDATVEKTHNFVANNIIVHNSLEQDADVVMFIYRKIMDKGIANCPEELRHVAEIHVAKHRNGPTGLVRLFFDENTVSFKNLAGKMDTPPPEDDF